MAACKLGAGAGVAAAASLHPSPPAAALQRSKTPLSAPCDVPQGIRSADRSRLLALCLAALEAQVAALPAGAGLLAGSAAQWRQLSTALLALSSVAAAAAWLGYVPEQLLEGAARKLRAADPAVLQAAGLAAAAAGVQQQAAAAAMAAAADGAAKSNASSAAGGTGTDEGGGGGEASDGTTVDWYCLGEKLQLYSSVLRLLTCSSIDQQQWEQQGGVGGAAGLGLPAPGQAAATAADGAGDRGGEAAGSTSGPFTGEPPGAGEQQAAGLAASSGAGGLARSQALLLLRQQQEQGGSLGSIRCDGAAAG